MKMSSDTKLPYTYSNRSRCVREQKSNNKHIRNVPNKDNVLNRFALVVTAKWILRSIIIFMVFLGMSSIIMGVYYTSTVNYINIIRPRLIDLHGLTRSNYSHKPMKSVKGHNTLIVKSDTKYISHNQSLNYRLTTVIGVNNSKSPHTKTVYPLTLDADYLLSDPNLCKSVTNLSALVIVHTAPDHFDRRDIMRKTWTNNSYFHHLGSVRILFLLGTVLDNATQRKIEDEFIKYGDLVQGNFIDAYRNLTHKGVMGYKWISENCMNAQIIVKTDDDVVVDTYKLLNEYIPKLSGRKRYILCNHHATDTVPILRETNNKWCVDSDLFRGHRFYPQYCSGFSVIISTDIIPFLYRAAYVTPFFWVDDVYLYGMLPSKVKDIAYISLSGNFSFYFKTGLECFENITKVCPFLISAGATAEEVVMVWDAMGKAYERSLKLNMKASNTSSKNCDTSNKGQGEKDSDKNQMPKQANVQIKEKEANAAIKDSAKMPGSQTENAKTRGNNTTTEHGDKGTDKGQDIKGVDTNQMPKQVSVQIKEAEANAAINDGAKMPANKTENAKTRANNTTTPQYYLEHTNENRNTTGAGRNESVS